MPNVALRARKPGTGVAGHRDDESAMHDDACLRESREGGRNGAARAAIGVGMGGRTRGRRPLLPLMPPPGRLEDRVPADEVGALAEVAAQRPPHHVGAPTLGVDLADEAQRARKAERSQRG